MIGRMVGRLPYIILVVLALSVGCVACAQPTPPRQAPFQNNYTPFEPKGLGALARWKLDAARNGLPPAPRTATPRVPPDLAFIRANALLGAKMMPAVTWIGHATALLQVGGLNVVTDPAFSTRASPFGFAGPKRAQSPGLALDQLPRIDAVVVSHNHYDHFDESSVLALNAQAGGPPLFLVPLGLKAWLAERGVTNVVELDWWQSHELRTEAGRTEFVMTPVQHWSGRWLSDRMMTLWGGWAIFAADAHVFFTGDTGYSKDFADIGARFAPRGGFDLALIAIGAYAPRWFMKDQHVDPAEALQIHRDVGARRSLGIHWGTFELTDEALDEPPERLAVARREQGLAEDDFFVLAIGETRRIEPRITPRN